MKRLLLPLVLAATLGAAEVDALAAALQGQDGPFTADRIQEVLMVTPRAQRAAAVKRIVDSGRDDVYGILHRLIQDEDPASAELAIDALAKRWPTSMQDVELIRTMLVREGRVGAAACRYAAAVGDDEALPALAERATRFPSDPAADTALRRLTALPGGVGSEGWAALVEARLERQEAAISGAERLLGGTPAEVMGALTLIAGMRPAGSRGARVLLAAAEHPDRTVRRMAISILGTCDAPAAAAWRNRPLAAGAEADSVAAAPASQGAGGGAGGVAGAPATAAIPAHPTAGPAVVGAAAPTASSGWIGWFAGIAAVLGCAGWLFVRRQHTPAAQVQDAAASRQGRFTWGG